MRWQPSNVAASNQGANKTKYAVHRKHYYITATENNIAWNISEEL